MTTCEHPEEAQRTVVRTTEHVIEVCSVCEGAAPRAEGLDVERLAAAIQAIRDYDDDYDAADEAEQVAAEYARLSRPSDEREQ